MSVYQTTATITSERAIWGEFCWLKQSTNIAEDRLFSNKPFIGDIHEQLRRDLMSMLYSLNAEDSPNGIAR